jgi:hypothetical protein
MSRWNRGRLRRRNEGPVQGPSETFCDARKHSTRGEARRLLHTQSKHLRRRHWPRACRVVRALCGSHRVGSYQQSIFVEPFVVENLKNTKGGPNLWAYFKPSRYRLTEKQRSLPALLRPVPTSVRPVPTCCLLCEAGTGRIEAGTDLLLVV